MAAPLFPRYIFVGLDAEHQRWRSVNGTVGISHLVCNGDQPLAIDSQVIEAIAAREDGDGLVQLASPIFLKPGQRVQITDGVFADQFGLFERLDDQDRVNILLDLLGRKVRVHIDVDMVVAA